MLWFVFALLGYFKPVGHCNVSFETILTSGIYLAVSDLTQPLIYLPRSLHIYL